MTVVVRRAAAEDAEVIAEFALRLFAQHRAYDPDRFARLSDRGGAAWYYGERAEADDAAVLVAELDGRIVGFAFLEYEELNYADLLENAVRLHDIFVVEEARGSGAGKKLIDAAAEKARSFGADKMILSVAAKNEFAKSFFESRGFKPTMVEMTLNLAD